MALDGGVGVKGGIVVPVMGCCLRRASLPEGRGASVGGGRGESSRNGSKRLEEADLWGDGVWGPSAWVDWGGEG